MKVFTHTNTLARFILSLSLCVVVASSILAYTPQTAHAQARLDRDAGIPSESATPKSVAANQTNTGGENRGGDWKTQLGQYIGYTILELAGKVTWVGGMLLEESIDWLVLDMGNKINTTSIGGTIDSLWTLVRDMCNLAFIFGFVYIGIRTIIDSDSSHVKSMLAQIIVGALLINFSLFIVKFVIDASNYVAVAIYNSMTTGEGSISAKFADIMGITTYFQSTGGDMLANLTAGGAISFYVMGSVLFMIAGFVFAAGAILLIIRFVALIFIMIFSPVLFAAIVFPGTAEYAKKLWSLLINYSLFAPAYLLLLLISIRVLEGVAGVMGVGNGYTLSGALQNVKSGGVTDSFGVIISFLIAIFFLIMSLQIAKQFGIAGASKVTSLATHGMGAMTAGLAARAGRATLGRGANWLSEREGLKDSASQKGIRGLAARGALIASRKASDSSFDARNTETGKSLGIGEGRKGGYKTVKDEIKKHEEEFGRSLGEVGDSDVRVTARKKEKETKEKELSDLRDAKEAEPTAAGKQILSGQIKAKEREIEDAKINYEKEKQRRIIGSTFANESYSPEVNEDLELFDVEIDGRKLAIKNAWNAYAALPEGTPAEIAAKKTERERIGELMVGLELTQSKKMGLLAKQKDRGYAGVLESDTWYTSWPTGRSVEENHYAGKKMREAAEKGLPKKKDA